MKNLAILQARTGSSRLPGKVLRIINNRTMIDWQISRIKNSSVKKIIVATSTEDADDKLVQEVTNLGITAFRGSLNDVHSRFLTILKENMPDYFIRLTGDCPLVMPSLLDKMISYFESSNFDYLSNVCPPTFPDGLDIEIISSHAFLEFSNFNLTDEEREHVTLGIRKRPTDFRIGNFVNDRDLSRMRWTVDYEEDFNFVSRIFEYFSGREVEFTTEDILQALDSGKFADNLVPAEYRNISLVNGVEGG